MQWYLIAILAAVITLAILGGFKKRYPGIKAHQTYGVLAITLIIVSMVLRVTLVPRVDNLYLQLGISSRYLISPDLLLAGTVATYGVLAILCFFNKGFQKRLNKLVENQWMAFWVSLLLVGVFALSFALSIYVPIYRIAF